MIFTIKLPKFYSQIDENTFFSWLKSIESVGHLKGRNVYLDIEIRETISELCFYELLSVLRRYRIRYDNLKYLENDDNKSWLRDEDAYWYEKLYG